MREKIQEAALRFQETEEGISAGSARTGSPVQGIPCAHRIKTAKKRSPALAVCQAFLYHRNDRSGRKSNRIPEPSLVQGHAGTRPKVKLPDK